MELRLLPVAKFVAESEAVGVGDVVGPGCIGGWMVACTGFDMREVESAVSVGCRVQMADKILLVYESNKALMATKLALEFFEMSPEMKEKFVGIVFKGVAAHCASHGLYRIVVGLRRCGKIQQLCNRNGLFWCIGM